MKINQEAAEREQEFESIARELGINIESKALQLVSLPSPTARRQIVRRVNPSKQKKMQEDISSAPRFTSDFFTAAAVEPAAKELTVKG